MSSRMPAADPKTPIGDPKSQELGVRAEHQSSDEEPNVPMMDPFTEQSTHSAGDGQGANVPAKEEAQRQKSNDDDEETLPIEKGFSPVP